MLIDCAPNPDLELLIHVFLVYNLDLVHVMTKSTLATLALMLTNVNIHTTLTLTPMQRCQSNPDLDPNPITAMQT